MVVGIAIALVLRLSPSTGGAYADFFRHHADSTGQISLNAYRRAEQAFLSMPTIATEPGRAWEFIGPKAQAVPYRKHFGMGPVSGRVNALAYDPQNAQHIYLGSTNGGLWRTTDGGKNWLPPDPILGGLPISSIAVNPLHPGVILIGTGDAVGFPNPRARGILVSRDGGKSWASVLGPPGLSHSAIRILEFDARDPKRAVALAAPIGRQESSAVFYSIDGGSTWSQSPATDAYTSLTVGQDGRLFLSGRFSGLSFSDDFGISWKPVPTKLPGWSPGNHTCSGASPNFPGTIYVADSSQQKLFKTTNNGKAWADITSGFYHGTEIDGASFNWSQHEYDCFIKVGNTVRGGLTEVVFVGLVDLVASPDGGAHWVSLGGPSYDETASTIHSDQHCLAIHPASPGTALIGNDGGVYELSYDPVKNICRYINLNRTLGLSTSYHAAFHPTRSGWMITGSQDNGSPYRQSSSAWKTGGGGDGGGCMIHPLDGHRQIATSQGGLVEVTSNAWLTSRQLALPLLPGETAPFICPVEPDPNDSDSAYIGAQHLYRYQFSTHDLEPMQPSLLFDLESSISSIGVSGQTGKVLYVGTNLGSLCYSFNGGITWQKVANTEYRCAITSISVNPFNPYDILITYSGQPKGGRVQRCSEIGANSQEWTSCDGLGMGKVPDAPCYDLSRDPRDPNRSWFLGHECGVLLTNNGGQTWSQATTALGLPMVAVREVSYLPQPRFVMAATFGRGVWRLPWP